MMFLLFLTTLISNLSYASSHETFYQTCITDSGFRGRLEYNLEVKGCKNLEEKLSSLKSFSEFIYPQRSISKKRKILNAPWTDDFPELYGLNKRLLNNVFMNNPLNESGDKRLELSSFKEFKNLTDLSFLPEYSYYKGYNEICEIIKNIPQIQTVTILSRELLNVKTDQCLSKLKNGIIIRDNFKGYTRNILSNIIGIEFFSGRLNKLAKLKKLRYLGISKQTNALAGIESIYKLSDLSHLSINIQNEIPDLEKISFLSSLEYLNITCSALENLNSDMTERCNSSSIIKEIDFLRDLFFLKHLNLSNNRLKDLLVLNTLSDLEHLNLRGNGLENLPQLTNLKKLKFLDLSQNNLKTIDTVETLKSLVLLNVADNKLENLTAISGHKNLRFLNLSNNPMIDLSESQINLPRLEVLNLNLGLGTEQSVDQRMKKFIVNDYEHERFNIFETLFSNEKSFAPQSKSCIKTSPIQSRILNFAPNNFPNLKVLTMRRNGIIQAPNISRLNKLIYFDIGNNKIKYFSSNDYSESLQYLHMDNNFLEEYPRLDKFIHLRELYLHNNLINDLTYFPSSPQSLNNILLAANLINDMKPISESVSFITRPKLDVHLDFNYIKLDYCDTFPGKHTDGCSPFKNWARKDLGVQYNPIEKDQLDDMRTWIKSLRCN